TVQNGLAVQNPNADPLCIEYDHSGSSLTDAESQLTTLVTEGPNQLSATVNKCAMYQVDHFTGPLYELDRAIFFNKATGTGGTALTKGTINGVPAPPSAIPGLPSNLGTIVNVPVVQACATQSGTGTGGGGGGGGGGLIGSVNPPSPG